MIACIRGCVPRLVPHLVPMRDPVVYATVCVGGCVRIASRVTFVDPYVTGGLRVASPGYNKCISCGMAFRGVVGCVKGSCRKYRPCASRLRCKLKSLCPVPNKLERGMRRFLKGRRMIHRMRNRRRTCRCLHSCTGHVRRGGRLPFVMSVLGYTGNYLCKATASPGQKASSIVLAVTGLQGDGADTGRRGTRFNEGDGDEDP